MLCLYVTEKPWSFRVSRFMKIILHMFLMNISTNADGDYGSNQTNYNRCRIEDNVYFMGEKRIIRVGI